MSTPELRARTQQAQRPTEVAVRQDTTMPVLQSKMDYAKVLAASAMLPAQYRGKPENLLWAVEYGEMLGLTPMAAITGVHVIEGKPTASAQLIAALIRRAGHKLRVSSTADRAIAQVVRKDDPEFVFRAEWTLDRARQAGLAGKDVWKKYGTQMLESRAIAEVGRKACPDVLLGLYTPDELGGDDWSAEFSVDSETVPAPTRVQHIDIDPEPEPEPVDYETGELPDKPPAAHWPTAAPAGGRITQAQSAKLHAARSES